VAAPKVQFRRLDQLTKDPDNARIHSADQVEMIAASIRRFGWTNPMLVDDVIRAGNGRYDAAQLIYAAGETIYMAPGKEHDGAKVPAGQVPVIDCTGWSEEDRTAYGLADNQIALQASWDTDRLRESLDSLAAADFDLVAIGFDQTALDALAESTSPVVNSGGAPADSTFEHTEQFGVIVMCKDEAEQEQVFNRLQGEGLSVKVVVV
jgi:ParB-like chromosome segregation protein Spo0J